MNYVVPPNKVILLIGDHYQTLGLLRSIGESGIEPVIVYYGNGPLIPNSKYARNFIRVTNNQEGLDYIIEHYGGESPKPFLFASSDKDVVEVAENRKARHPAYVLTIDFGSELGQKKSSAQITSLYTPKSLVGKQIVCCVNLYPMHIGSVKSEVRILGSDSEQGVVLLRPDMKVENGDNVY